MAKNLRCIVRSVFFLDVSLEIYWNPRKKGTKSEQRARLACLIYLDICVCVLQNRVRINLK